MDESQESWIEDLRRRYAAATSGARAELRGLSQQEAERALVVRLREQGVAHLTSPSTVAAMAHGLRHSRGHGILHPIRERRFHRTWRRRVRSEGAGSD